MTTTITVHVACNMSSIRLMWMDPWTETIKSVVHNGDENYMSDQNIPIDQPIEDIVKATLVANGIEQKSTGYRFAYDHQISEIACNYVIEYDYDTIPCGKMVVTIERKVLKCMDPAGPSHAHRYQES